MHPTQLNLDQLAEETFQISEELEQEFKCLDGEDRFQLLEDRLVNAVNKQKPEPKNEIEPVNEEIPDSPGLFYWIDLGKSTFILRAAPTDNLKQTMHQLFDEQINYLDILKIKSTEDENLALLNFYETETYEMAEVIRDQLANRRFPYKEEQICNISDPGFTWWASMTNKSIKIFFRSYGFMDDESLIKLGPIGDQKIAQIRFDQATAIMGSFFPVSEYSCSGISVTIATDQPGNIHFEIFKNIFSKGEFDGQLKHFPKAKNSLTLYFYFKELAIVRNFWLQLEKSISHFT